MSHRTFGVLLTKLNVQATVFISSRVGDRRISSILIRVPTHKHTHTQTMISHDIVHKLYMIMYSKLFLL